MATQGAILSLNPDTHLLAQNIVLAALIVFTGRSFKGKTAVAAVGESENWPQGKLWAGNW